MATAQERIKQIDHIENQSMGIGLIPAVILGLIVAAPLGREAGAGLFVGFMVWLATYQMLLMASARTRAPWRYAGSWGLGLAAFLITFAVTEGTASAILPLITFGTALGIVMSMNQTAEKSDKVAFYETKIIETATSTTEKKKPDAQRRKIEDYQRQLQQALEAERTKPPSGKQPISAMSADYKVKRLKEIQDQSWWVALIPAAAAALYFIVVLHIDESVAGIIYAPIIYYLARDIYANFRSRTRGRWRRLLTWAADCVFMVATGSVMAGLFLALRLFNLRFQKGTTRVLAWCAAVLVLLVPVSGLMMLADGSIATANANAQVLWQSMSLSSLLFFGVALFNMALDRSDKVNQYETQIIMEATSAAARKSASQAASKVSEIEAKRAQLLEKQYAGLLSKAERKPMSFGARRTFMRVVGDLGAIEKPSGTQQTYLGRAYLGAARHLAAYDDRNALHYVKQAQKYPLSAEGTDFVARYYALTKAADKEAAAAYTGYVRSHKGKPRDPLDTVYMAAQNLCTVAQNNQPARLKEAETQALAFLSADDTLGWAALCAGQSQLWQGRPAEAVAQLTRAAQLMPNSLDAAFFLGQAQLAEKNINQALTAFRRALVIDPAHIDTKFYLGYALVADGRAETFMGNLRREIVEEACGYLEAVLLAQPKRAEAEYALGLAYFAAENYRVAKLHFGRALSLDASAPDWHYQYARSLAALGEYEGAMQAGQQVLNRAPQHRGALALMAGESIRAKQWATAEAHYRAMLALDAADEQANLGLGRALFELGQYEEAITYLHKPVAPDLERERLYYLGRSQSMRGNFQESLSAYQQAIQAGGPDAATYYAVGCAYANLGQWQPALAALKQSLDVEQSSRAYIQQGHVLMAMGNRQAAFDAYQHAAGITPDLADAHYAVGLYYYLDNDPETARIGFNNALKCDPDFALAHLGLGAIYEARGKLEDAQENYTRALDNGAPPNQVLLRIGVIAARRGLSAEAIEPLTQARQIGVDSDELHYYLGLAHARLAHWQEAVEAWSIFQQRNPDDQATLLNLTRCRYHLGHERFATGAYAAGAEAWEACIAVYQDEPELKQAIIEAYFRQGVVLLTQSDQLTKTAIKNARKAFKRALALTDEGDRRLQFFGALSTLAEGDYPAAVDALRAMLESDGANADDRIAYHLGLALHQAGRTDEAVPYFEQALQAPLPPHLHLGARLALAGIHTDAERWSEAAEMYRRVFAADESLAQ
jgi:tetratricopeptide (TPR) repeat protein